MVPPPRPAGAPRSEASARAGRPSRFRRPGPGDRSCPPRGIRTPASSPGALHPRVVAGESVLPPRLVLESEVTLDEGDQVGGSLAREHPLDDVLVRRVPFRLLLEDPAAGSGAKDVAPALTIEDVGAVPIWRVVR